MEKEKVMHVLSVLLDELTKSIWRESVMCWELTGDSEDPLLITLDIYEGYTISLRHITKLVEMFEVKLNDISCRTEHGVLEIKIEISSINASE